MLDILQHRIAQIVLSSMLETILSKVKHCHQWIVQFMRNAGNQYANGAHLRLLRQDHGLPLKTCVGLFQFLRILYALADIANVALNYFPAVNPIGVAHKLHVSMPSIIYFER